MLVVFEQQIVSWQFRVFGSATSYEVTKENKDSTERYPHRPILWVLSILEKKPVSVEILMVWWILGGTVIWILLIWTFLWFLAWINGIVGEAGFLCEIDQITHNNCRDFVGLEDGKIPNINLPKWRKNQTNLGVKHIGCKWCLTINHVQVVWDQGPKWVDSSSSKSGSKKFEENLEL